jgi:hypothetical protein
VNANDATLTELATAQSGSMVKDDAPNAPAGGGFDLIIGAVAGSALGSSGAPYTLTISAIDLTTVSQPWPPQILHQAFDEVPRAFRTAHPLGWAIWKGEVIAPTEEELLTGIQG